MTSATVPKLSYFGLPGRVFGLRVALFKAFGKDGWTDHRVGFQDWRELKPTTPLGGLPTLELPDGTVLVQAESLARWAAKHAGLYPADPMEALRVDEVAATAFEVLNKCPQDPDPEVKKAKRVEYGFGFMQIGMSLLEKRLTTGASASSGFLLQSGISLADLQVYVLTDMILTGQFDHIDPGYMNAYPGLLAAHAAVKADPIVVEYLANYPN